MVQVKHTENTSTQPQPAPHPSFTMAMISHLLLDSINLQINAAFTEAKTAEANAKLQEKLIGSLAKHPVKSLPADAWTRKQTHKLIPYHPRPDYTVWVLETVWVKVPKNNGALEKYDAENQEAVKIRQGLQNALNGLQQNSSINQTAFEAYMKGCAQSQSQETAVLDTFLAITKKIFSKR